MRRNPFIIAEISCNHAGNFAKATELVRMAARADADAVKFQIWDKDRMCVDPYYELKDGTWKGRKLKDLYAEAWTDWRWIPALFKLARSLGVFPMASVFDTASLSLAQRHDCAMYKIASFELPDTRLIYDVALMHKPIVISTGMAEGWEIAEAVQAVHRAGNRDLTLLHCRSGYPTAQKDLHLSTIWHLRQCYGCDGVNVGFSDHTKGIGAAIAAVGMGATMIEKHLELGDEETLDSAFSLDPGDFKIMVDGCRQAVGTKGEPTYGVMESEKPQAKLRRSLYFAADLPTGTVIEGDHIVSARPALGVTARAWRAIIGARLLEDVKRDQPVRYELLHKDSPWPTKPGPPKRQRKSHRESAPQ